MIRILIADDQKAIHWLLKNFLEEKQNIDLVGIADNGKTAVELVNRLSPDVVLLDLCMPIMDGLSATKLITKSHQQTKIIIFSSQENEQFVAQTIMAGANGYLLKKSARENIAVALQTVSEGKYYLDPQLAAANILDRELPIIQDSKLDNYTHFLAQKVIDLWRSQASVKNLSATEFIADSGLEIDRSVGAISPIIFELERSSENISLFKKLSIPLNLLQQGTCTRKNINSNYMLEQLRKSEVEIKDWFERNYLVQKWSSDVSQPHLNIQSITAKIFTKFEDNIAILWQNAGSKVALAWLRELESILQTIEVNYKNQHQNQIQKETSAWSAFYILSNELATSKKKAGDINHWSAAWKALLFAYKFKLYATLYEYAIEQLITELIRRVKAYKSTAIKTDSLLLDLQSRFEQNIHTETDLTLLAFDWTGLVDPLLLRKELESRIGCPLNQWGIADSIDYRLLHEWLTAKIQPIADRLYMERDRTAIISSDDFSIRDRIKRKF